MKIAIISEGPVALALDLLLQRCDYETQKFQQKEFQPTYIQERSLDAVLIYGQTVADEGYAIAVRKNVPAETEVYFLHLQRELEFDLAAEGVQTWDILDTQLLEKLRGLRK